MSELSKLGRVTCKATLACFGVLLAEWWGACTGQQDLCESFWSKESFIEEPLRHFLHESRGLFPAVTDLFLHSKIFSYQSPISAKMQHNREHVTEIQL